MCIEYHKAKDCMCLDTLFYNRTHDTVKLHKSMVFYNIPMHWHSQEVADVSMYTGLTAGLTTDWADIIYNTHSKAKDTVVISSCMHGLFMFILLVKILTKIQNSKSAVLALALLLIDAFRDALWVSRQKLAVCPICKFYTGNYFQVEFQHQ